MNIHKKRIECQTLKGAYSHQQACGSESTHRLVKALRVLIPAVLVSIALIACADNASIDTTPPVVNGIRLGTSAATSVTITVNTNETGKLFWVAYANGTPPPTTSAALITAAGKAKTATIVANSGSDGHEVSAKGTQTVTISELSADTNYDFYVVAQNAAGNTSSISVKLDIATVPMFTLRPASLVTILCPDAAIGDTGTVNGVIYTKRARGAMGDISGITPANAATTCTSGITDMSELFKDDATFNADIGSWDVSSVTDMSDMFDSAGAFNQDIGSWNVSSVTDTNGMFFSSSAFNADIGRWDVSSVTDMSSMFSTATAFSAYIGRWDVSSVADMSSMFNTARAFNQNIGRWDVSSVTDMVGMFANAPLFNQNLSGWCVSGLTAQASFSSGVVFLTANKPVWGTTVSSCPSS